jgi:hypothetical protein
VKLASVVLEADWVLRRVSGCGLRAGSIDSAHADPDAPGEILTSVIWLPPAITGRLQELGAAFAAEQPGQYAYPAESIHMTLVGPAGRAGQDGSSVLDDLREVAPLIAETRLRLAGLCLGSSTVYARLEASGDGLVEARRILRDRWASTAPSRIERLLRERLMWATVVRFTAPPTPAFIEAVARRRRIRSDSFRIGSVVLARSNRVMAAGRTVQVGEVRLDPTMPDG